MSYVECYLKQQGFEGTLEHDYKLGSGVLKPDLVAKQGSRVFIMYAKIVGDDIDVQEVHKLCPNILDKILGFGTLSHG